MNQISWFKHDVYAVVRAQRGYRGGWKCTALLLGKVPKMCTICPNSFFVSGVQVCAASLPRGMTNWNFCSSGKALLWEKTGDNSVRLFPFALESRRCAYFTLQDSQVFVKVNIQCCHWLTLPKAIENRIYSPDTQPQPLLLTVTWVWSATCIHMMELDYKSISVAAMQHRVDCRDIPMCSTLRQTVVMSRGSWHKEWRYNMPHKSSSAEWNTERTVKAQWVTSDFIQIALQDTVLLLTQTHTNGDSRKRIMTS